MTLKAKATLLLGCLSAIASAQGPARAGLLTVMSSPNHPELTDKVFNDWYSNEHIQDMVKSTVTDLVVRYKNVNSSAQWPYLAIYRIPDVSKLSDQKIMGSVPATSKLLPGKEKGSKGGAWKEIMKMETSAYLRTQTFEGQTPKTGRGKGLITSYMEPANGTDVEFDQWYRHQHLDMLSMLKGYRRSTRFQKLDRSSPRFLAIHEMDTTTVSPEIRIVMGTEWAKKVVGTAKFAGRDSWELISEFGKGSVGELF